MWNAFVWISDLIALALVLFLAGMMISTWMRNSQTAKFTNQRSLSQFQTFVSSIYGRLTFTGKSLLITLCLDLTVNFGRMYPEVLLSLSISTIVLCTISVIFQTETDP